MKRIIIAILMSCVANLGDSIAQNNNSQAVQTLIRTDSLMSLQLQQIEQRLMDIEQQKNFAQKGTDNNDNADFSLLSSLVIALLSLANLILLIVLLRRQDKPVPIGMHDKSEVRQSVGKADTILNAIGGLSIKISELEKKISPQSSTNNIQPHTTPNIQPHSQPQQHQPGFNSQPQKKVNKEPLSTHPLSQPQCHTLYVQPQEENGHIVLVNGGEDYKDMMPFVLLDRGSEGHVSFNSASLETSLSSLETAIIPYSNCSVDAVGQPQRIDTVKEGRAQKRGEEWVLVERPSLRVL